MQHTISTDAWLDEAQAVARLLSYLEPVAGLDGKITSTAAKLAKALRKKSGGGGIEAFLHEYGLSSREGIAVMCLAEALLRIPDAATADRLIRDTFAKGAWEKHLGRSESFFVNASSWGLLLTGKAVKWSHRDRPHPIARLVEKFSEPVIREALKSGMRFIGGRFVLGETIEDAVKHARAHKHARFSFDMLGEGARSDAQARAYVEAYRHAIDVIGKEAQGQSLMEAPGISIKLSALHPRFELRQERRVMAELLPRLRELAAAARAAGISLAIDAEEAGRLDITLRVFSELFADRALDGWEGCGFVVQAYQKRAFALIDVLAALAQKHRCRMPLRLVKGAYWDYEIKTAQMQGLPGYPVFTRKEHTDVSYLACADKILRHGKIFYPQFATHNARTVAGIVTLAAKLGVKDYEMQRLHGMGEALHAMIDVPSRVYAPVGRHKDLLAYLIRRLLENGANTSFVHLLMDHQRPVAELIADPLAAAKAQRGEPNPDIPLPAHLYGNRKNSQGIDFGNRAQVEKLLEEIESSPSPAKAGEGRGEGLSSPQSVQLSARNLPHPGPLPRDAGEGEVQKAKAAFPAWSQTSVEERARMLEKAADAIEQHRAELMALIAREAKRTLIDGAAEVREAADFCRYYASAARRLFKETMLTGPTGESNALRFAPRGVFACISPWNFPLAIFTGQIAAALAAGNCAVAKPAGQTPRIAARAVALLHAVGIPRDALQLMPGDGKIGAKLVADPRIDGVVFTGSVEAAQSINRALAARPGPIAPLIAETGGQNCMVVDSSALLEQAADDILLSTFGSAGQRCSSLRVLYVQHDIADELTGLLAGAMRELSLGDPLKLSTDIGPVIDEEAHATLAAHISRMKQSARWIASAELPKEKGLFIAPHVFEIKHIGELEKEIFGPVLHIIRFHADERERVVQEINSTGYGLTFGIQSRIGDTVDFFVSRVHAGNIYVNRSMTGATVGVQPFGGEGLSGTGPKAGGPHYLPRFMVERVVTVNTAAIGGNAALLSA